MFLFLLKVLEVRLLLLEREHLIYLISKQDQFVIANLTSSMLSLLVLGPKDH